MAKCKKFAACIITQNNEKTISQCMNSVLSQSHKFNELVIVDGESKDNTVKIAKTLLRKNKIKYKIIVEHKAGLAEARNIAYRNSNSDYIAFIDSDVVINYDWLKNVEPKFIENDEDAITSVESLKVEVKQPFWHKYAFVPSVSTTDNSKENYVTGTSFGATAIKRKFLDDVNGFQTYSLCGEDADIVMRLRKFKKDFKFLVLPGAKWGHYKVETFLQYIKRMYYWGKGNARVAILHKNPKSVKKSYIYAMFLPLIINVFFPNLFFMVLAAVPPLLFLAFFLFSLYHTKYVKVNGYKFYEIPFVCLIFLVVCFAFGLGVITQLPYVLKPFKPRQFIGNSHYTIIEEN